MNKKIWLILIVATGLSSSVNAQSTRVKEWLRQKKTQREYLINQIAALQVYINYAKKGYEIYQEGLTLIGNFNQGEFKLHDDFFLSLKNINPEIARYTRVADIVRLQSATAKCCQATLRETRNDGFVNGKEMAFLTRVFDRVMADCERITEELIALTKAGNYELKDDERLQRIDMLHEEAEKIYRFAKSFGDGAIGLKHARMQVHSDIGQAKLINY